MKCLNCKNLGWGEEYSGKKFFGWCKEVCDAPELDREREREHFVQATNSDIIRRMSDEELACFLKRCMFDDFKPPCKKATFFTAENRPDCDENCVACIKGWLRQPAEED